MSSSAGVSPNLMKKRMEAGELALGMIVRNMRGVEIATMAKSAGFDCLYMDLEHSAFSLETVGQISMMAVAVGVTPLVRLAGLDQADISRTLEAGAQGVIIPHLETRAQAEKVVEAAKFPPLGGRSLLSANPHSRFLAGPTSETMGAMNEATLVTTMIECCAAVENADDIASVEGLDMLLVGPNDLSNELGVPGQLDHPKVMEAYEHVAACCRNHGKHMGVGGMGPRPDLAKELVARGARYISTGSDTAFLMSAARAAVKAFR